MIRQICRDYHLDNWRSLDIDEIEFFYDGLRPELKKLAQLAKKAGK